MGWAGVVNTSLLRCQRRSCCFFFFFWLLRETVVPRRRYNSPLSFFGSWGSNPGSMLRFFADLCFPRVYERAAPHQSCICGKEAGCCLAR